MSDRTPFQEDFYQQATNAGYQSVKTHNPHIYLQLMLKRLCSLWALLTDERLGVLSRTDLLTGTLDLARDLPKVVHEAEEFFTEACFSPGKDPTPVN